MDNSAQTEVAFWDDGTPASQDRDNINTAEGTAVYGIKFEPAPVTVGGPLFTITNHNE